MRKSTRAHSTSRNKALLLFLLFLDLAGFTLIFPIIPAMLDHYTQTAQLDQNNLDLWLLHLLDFLDTLLPINQSSQKNKVIILGGGLACLYSFTQFIAAPHWGRLSDRLGRRPILLISSLGLGLSYVGWFFSSSFTFFCLTRLLGGLMGGNLGVASAAMADMSPPEKRTSSMGMIGAAFGLGFLLGPCLGGLCSNIDLGSLAKHPFSGAALVAAILSLASALLNLFFLQETLDNSKRRPVPWIANPYTSLKEVKNPVYNRVIVINFIYFFIFSAYEFTFSFYYSIAFGLSVIEIGLVFFYLGCWSVIGQGWLVRILSQRKPPQYLLSIGLIAMPLPVILFGLCAPSVSLSLAVLIPISLSSALLPPSLASLASLSIAEDRQGYALGLLRSCGSLGRALAPLVAAPLYWRLGPQYTYLLLGSGLALVSIYTLRSKWHLKS